MLGKSNDASHNDINVSDAKELPGDSVSSIAWFPNTNTKLFSCAAWDSKIRFYEVAPAGNSAKLVLKNMLDVEDPCLSVAWCDDDNTKMFAGSVNGTVKLFDLQSNKFGDIGRHDASVKSVYWIPKANIVLSLSHDKTARFWDPRQQQQAGAFNIGQKVFCSDMFFPYVALGLSDEKLSFIDLNNIQNMKAPEFYESPLGKGSQVTCISFTTDGAGFGVGAHDGRANVSKFVNQNGKVKLETVVQFKTKKYPENTPLAKQILYPVHDIGFNNVKKDFVYTDGGEGAMTFWDFNKRDKLKTYEFNGVPVTRSKMSPDGQLLAYSLGYDWSVGIQGYMSCPTRICVHIMQEGDFTGK